MGINVFIVDKIGKSVYKTMRYEMKFLEFLFTSEVLIGLLINAKVS